jgi:hypothetical protein
MLGNKKLALLLAFCGFLGALSCEWTDKDSEEFYSMLMVGTVIGAIAGIILCVAAGLPLCCGIGKEWAKVIAGIVIGLGIFICFIPAIAGKAQGDGAVDKMCDRCANGPEHDQCKNDDREKAKDAIGALGVLVAYIHAFGFVVVILGATAAGMACCICCKCCKMKEEPEMAGSAPPAVQGQVVGTVSKAEAEA